MSAKHEKPDVAQADSLQRSRVGSSSIRGVDWVHITFAIGTPPILPLARGGAEGGGVFLRN